MVGSTLKLIGHADIGIHLRGPAVEARRNSRFNFQALAARALFTAAKRRMRSNPMERQRDTAVRASNLGVMLVTGAVTFARY